MFNNRDNCDDGLCVCNKRGIKEERNRIHGNTERILDINKLVFESNDVSNDEKRYVCFSNNEKCVLEVFAFFFSIDNESGSITIYENSSEGHKLPEITDIDDDSLKYDIIEVFKERD